MGKLALSSGKVDNVSLVQFKMLNNADAIFSYFKLTHETISSACTGGTRTWKAYMATSTPEVCAKSFARIDSKSSLPPTLHAAVLRLENEFSISFADTVASSCNGASSAAR